MERSLSDAAASTRRHVAAAAGCSAQNFRSAQVRRLRAQRSNRSRVGAAAPCYGARPKKEMYGRSDGGFAAERRRGTRRGGAGFVCAPHPAGPLAGGAPPGMGTIRAANKSGTRERGRKTELFCQITERITLGITERCCPLPGPGTEQLVRSRRSVNGAMSSVNGAGSSALHSGDLIPKKETRATERRAPSTEQGAP
jgi:hypothetical protein